MNSLSVLGKYLDQPMLVSRFKKSVPAVLIAGSGVYAYKHIQNTPQEEKKKESIRTFCVLAGTIAAALAAPKLIKKLFKEATHGGEHGHEHGIESVAHIKEENKELIEDFLKNNKVTQKTEEILNKAKSKILKPSEIKTVFEELGDKPEAKEFLKGEEGLIPDPENIDSKHIFGEIGELSVYGLMPVLGGMAGGVVGDKLTDKKWKEKVPNKVKEGVYQYLANIFLCNVGAGVALAILEKANVKSKAWRATGMIAGILLTGVVFGSAIANLVGKTVVDPLLAHKNNNKKLYDERKPEALDIGLHIDDVATVAVLSGLKWIEPSLPILYSISGYRAGIGYRNNEKAEKIDKTI